MLEQTDYSCIVKRDKVKISLKKNNNIYYSINKAPDGWKESIEFILKKENENLIFIKMVLLQHFIIFQIEIMMSSKKNLLSFQNFAHNLLSYPHYFRNSKVKLSQKLLKKFQK